MKRALALAAIAAWGLVVAAVAIGALALGTERGARWTLERFGPETLTVERVEGRLLGPLTLSGVAYRGAASDVEAERVHLEWRPGRLLRRTVRIELLAAEGITVSRKDAEDPPDEEGEPTSGLPEMELPLALELERLEISHLEIHGPADGATGEAAGNVDPLRIDRILASGSGSGSDFRIGTLRGEGPGFSMRAEGRFATEGDYPLDLALRWTARPAEAPEAAGSASVRGSLSDLALRHTLTAPIEARLEARATDVLEEDAEWTAELRVPRFRLPSLRGDLPGHRLEVDLRADGGRDRANLRGTFAAVLEQGPEVEGETRLEYAGDRVGISTLALRLPRGQSRLTASGEVILASPGGERARAAGPPRFRLEGEWQSLSWPPRPDPPVSSPTGAFAVKGTAEAYALVVDAAVAGASVPAGQWYLQGRGTETKLALETVRGRTLGGRLEGDAAVAWDPHPAWEIGLTGDDVNPGAFAPEWPGRLAFDLGSRGELADERVRASVDLQRLEGTLRGRTVDGAARASVDDDRLELERLLLRSGSAEVDVSGQVEESWDVAWTVSAPDLSDLLPGTRGELLVGGSVEGPRGEPRLAVTLRGDSVTAGEALVRELRGDLAVDLSDREASRVDLRAAGIETGERVVERLRLEGDGTTTGHRIALAAGGGPDSLVLTLSGGYGEESGTWSGAIERLELVIARGHWALRDEVPLVAGTDSARLEQLCLAGQGASRGRLCLEGEWREGAGGRGRLRGDDFPLALLEPALPEGFEVEGTVETYAEADIGSDGALRAEGRLFSGPGAFRYRIDPGESIERRYDSFRTFLELDDREMIAELDFGLAEGGGARGELRVSRDGPPEARALDGRLTAEFPDGGLAGALVDDLMNTGGLLRADLSARGTAADPVVSGTLALERGRADVIPAGVELREMGLRASGDGSRTLSLTGEALSGEGRLDLEGDIRLPAAGAGTPSPGGNSEDGTGTDPGEAWAARFTLRGDRFLAFATTDARVRVSPDLSIRGDPAGIDVRGDVEVPAADITPAETAGAVTPSRDAVIVAGGSTEEERQPPIPVSSEVRVTLGDRVFLDAFGLTGRLAGTLVVVDRPPRPTVGRGELQILDGEYTAYRQTLEIDRGRLIFADGPIRNPGLDLRVVRRADEVTAGLDVSGTAEDPTAELFSEPPLPESEALAYLLLGRPLRGASQSEGELLHDAATSAGLAGGNLIAARLGARFGLEEARIEEGDDLSEAALVLGTYLSPRLYVGYSIGLFEAANVLRARYRLGRSWILQTETGFETGADLFYTVER